MRIDKVKVLFVVCFFIFTCILYLLISKVMNNRNTPKEKLKPVKKNTTVLRIKDWSDCKLDHEKKVYYDYLYDKTK